MTGERAGRPPHRLPRGAAGGRAPGVARRGPRRGRRAGVLPWSDRETVRDAYAATVVKRQVAAADLRRALRPLLPAAGRRAGRRRAIRRRPRRTPSGPRTTTTGAGRPSASGWPRRWSPATSRTLHDLAVEAVGRFGAMPGRGAGAVRLVGVHRAAAGRPRRSWSTGSSPRCCAGGRADDEARRAAGRRVGAFTAPGRGRRPPPDRGGEGARPRGRRRDPARRSTGSTSPPRGAPTSRRCAARSTRSPVGSRPG